MILYRHAVQINVDFVSACGATVDFISVCSTNKCYKMFRRENVFFVLVFCTNVAKITVTYHLPAIFFYLCFFFVSVLIFDSLFSLVGLIFTVP